MHRPLAVIVGLVLMTGSPGAQESEPLAEALALLDVRLSRAVARSGQPSLSIAVSMGESVWTRSYGYADLERRRLATPDTFYHIGSITKTFTAVAILQLRDDGRLGLDDPVDLHLPAARIHAVDPDAANVTIRELLTHSAGLQREVPGTDWTPWEFPPRGRLMEPVEQIFGAGATWKYSNLGYGLLGEVVASASGASWHDYVHQNILSPLGMADTATRPRSNEPGFATGYSRANPHAEYTPKVRRDFGALAPAAGMASTAKDLLQYLRFHLGTDAADDVVLSPRTLREMHRPHWMLENWQAAWGLGVGITRFNERIRIQHGGGVPGYLAQWELIPSLQLGVVVLTNSDDGNPGGHSEYVIQLLAPILEKELAAAEPLAPIDPDIYRGLYSAGVTTRFITMLDGHLSAVDVDAANPYAGRFVLEPTTQPHTFVMRWPPEALGAPDGETIVFEFDSDGAVTAFRHGVTRFPRLTEGGEEAEGSAGR